MKGKTSGKMAPKTSRQSHGARKGSPRASTKASSPTVRSRKRQAVHGRGGHTAAQPSSYTTTVSTDVEWSPGQVIAIDDSGYEPRPWALWLWLLAMLIGTAVMFLSILFGIYQLGLWLLEVK